MDNPGAVVIKVIIPQFSSFFPHGGFATGYRFVYSYLGMTQVELLILLLAGIAPVIAILAITLRRLVLPPATADLYFGKLRPFRSESYRPMERLLHDRDEAFLESQEGFDPSMRTRLRRERKSIFRAYLRHLSHDYSEFHAAARFLVAHCPSDRPDLAFALMRHSLRFWSSIAIAWVWVEFAHVPSARSLFDVRSLVEAPRWMEMQVSGLVSLPSAA